MNQLPLPDTAFSNTSSSYSQFSSTQKRKEKREVQKNREIKKDRMIKRDKSQRYKYYVHYAWPIGMKGVTESRNREKEFNPSMWERL